VSEAARRFSAFESAVWSEQAGTYDRLSGRATARAADALLDAAGVGAGTRVLDVGCGPGAVVAAALARGAEPTGVDVAPGMLAEARRRHPGVTLIEADLVDLPLPDGAFPAAVGNFVFNHLPEPERAAAELRRVLAPGGAVALSVWGPPERNRWLGLVGEALDEAGVPAPAVVAAGPSPDRFGDPDQMRALLEDAGFGHVRVEVLTFAIDVPDADALWDGVLGGSVRTSAAVRAQPPEVRDRARAALGRRAEAHRGPEGLALPAEVVIGAGRG
jgi:ubiquinone/menaquinone biosynthesis C-methylase UbiE